MHVRPDIWAPIVSAVSGLVGAFLGAVLGAYWQGRRAVRAQDRRIRQNREQLMLPERWSAYRGLQRLARRFERSADPTGGAPDADALRGLVLEANELLDQITSLASSSTGAKAKRVRDAMAEIARLPGDVTSDARDTAMGALNTAVDDFGLAMRDEYGTPPADTGN
jgi:hypothetical protein